MSKLIRRMSLLILSSLLLSPSASHALGGNTAHVGFSAGQSTLVRQGNPNETSVGYKIFGGLHATGPFLVEVSHVNLGKYFEDTASEREVSGNALHLVGKLPFTASVAALAKVGLFSWDVQYNNSNTSTTGSDTAYGFAIIYAMPIGYTLRVEWEQFSDVGKVSTTTGNDMTFLSVGISLTF